jgi:Tfp pilus assembly protein FimT
LIELITVIAVIVIILGILFANFRNFGGTARLEEDVNELTALIRSARQDSISVRQYGTGYPSFGVYFRQTGNQTFVYTDGTPAAPHGYINNGLTPPVTNESVSFSPGVTITEIAFKKTGVATTTIPAASGASVLFLRPGPVVQFIQGTAAASQTILGSGTLTITLTGSDGTRKRISINSNGHVRTY